MNSEQSENWNQNMKTKSLNESFQVQFKYILQLQKESAQEDEFIEEIYARKWFPKSFTENLKDVYLTCATFNIQHTLNEHDVV